MLDQLHIVMLASEIFPFAKTGGLADVVSALSIALEHSGQRASLIMPAYRCTSRASAEPEDTGIHFTVPVAGRKVEANLLRAKIGRDISVYLVRADPYFDREGLYRTDKCDYPDNAERFVFFCRAAFETIRQISPVHILHAHDWQAALAIAFLKADPEINAEFFSLKSVFTVHNLGYQGLFPREKWHVLGLDESFFASQYLEYYGKINSLKGGLVWADAITTVSPTYATEIQTSEYGCGLDGVLRQRAAGLMGILNGVDYGVWNPAIDPVIAKNYNRDDTSGKRLCKAELQRLVGLPEASEVPLIGIVSRLASQKGLDLVEEVFEQLLGRDLQFVLLGAGDSRYQNFFHAAAVRHQAKVAVRIAHDEVLSHRIEAGADIFLMPSRYEPCGLNQIYSLKYGTIPIVRATGGLKDTVADFDPATQQGNGFVFENYDGAALLAAVDRALAVFRQKDQWARLMDNAMSADFSWNRSADEYLKLYRRLVDSRRSSPE